MPANKLLLSSSPHAFSPVSTQRIMLAVIIALLPATGYGIYLYGLPALLLVLVSMVAAAAGEFLFRLAIKAPRTIDDCSAALTGLLLALILPPSTPLWMAALGAIFSTVVVKEFFGGLGQNSFNPALTGRAFLLMSFPAAITTWHKPMAGLVDAATTATPLNVVKQAMAGGSGMGEALAQAADKMGLAGSGELYLQLFLGNRSGSLGESSILLLLLGGLFLLLIGVIQWIIPVTVLGSTALFSLLLGMDPLFALLSGGVVLGAFFMATDYASSPLTPVGKVVFGCAIGLLVVLIRRFGGFPEGVTYAILIMNMAVPFLDKVRVKKYGYVKPAPAAKGASK